MRQGSSAVLMLAALTAAACFGAPAVAASQPAPVQHDIPQSQVYEHTQTMEQLAVLAHRKGAVGVAARNAQALFKRHIAREEEYILPPLTLLPDLADGKVTPDMAWAVAMADRVKADREKIFQEHTEVTGAMNALYAAGQRAHDKEAIALAQSAAVDSLNDSEIMEPMALLIGDYLRAKLPPAH